MTNILLGVIIIGIAAIAYLIWWRTQKPKADEMKATLDDKFRINRLETSQQLDEKFRIAQGLTSQQLSALITPLNQSLANVNKGFGEMQNLTVGVNALNLVMTKSNTRGTWGELHLEALLERLLDKNHYEKQWKVREDKDDRVDFAVRVYIGDEERMLPFDSKFPVDDYKRLMKAENASTKAAVESASSKLESVVRNEAKNIKKKYVMEPQTTDYAIMFLPSEGLWADILNREKLLEELLLKHRIVPSGPSSTAAILNNARMGHRALAINKNAGMVVQVLLRFKKQFTLWEDWTNKLKSQSDTLTKTILKCDSRMDEMDKVLKKVEALPIHDDTKVSTKPTHSEELDSQ